jgi:Domain of unknown function (DUF4349)
MTNHPIEQEELMAYLDGELPVDRAGVAAAHLERCRECQSLAADLEGISRRLMEWQVDLGQASHEIGPTVAAALIEPAAKPRKHPRLVRRWVWAVAGTGLAALLVIPTFQLASRRYKMQLVGDQIDAVQAPRRTVKEPLGLVASDTVLGPPMIARTAELSLTTNQFDKARTALEEILKRHSGYLGQLNVNAPAGAGRTLDATLRIPADQRDIAIAEIKKLGRVDSESQTGEEVTAQYVDLEARLTNARNTEERLTEVLRQRTGKLADVLAVEEAIARVRGEIEQMGAEKKSLSKRVEFLTLVVKVTEDYRAQLQLAPDSILGRFRNAAVAGYKSMVEGVVAFILFLLSYGPSLLIWAALLFFPARYAWKKFRRHTTPST